MNVKEITELFDYNLWANNRLFEAAAQLPTDHGARSPQTDLITYYRQK
jgi:uncharacterized damage-inducible protein DinB